MLVIRCDVTNRRKHQRPVPGLVTGRFGGYWSFDSKEHAPDRLAVGLHGGNIKIVH